MRQLLVLVWLFLGALVVGCLYGLGHWLFADIEYAPEPAQPAPPPPELVEKTPPPPVWPAPLATEEYDERLLALVDYTLPVVRVRVATSTATSTSITNNISIGTTSTAISTATSGYDVAPPRLVSTTTTKIIDTRLYASSTNVTVKDAPWPKAQPYPHGGALLPFNRVVAYYGNFFSRRMGILGEFERAEVLSRLAKTAADYEAADPDTPVVPAIHYIAIVAQAEAGEDGLYRSVMPDEHIERAISMAEEINGVTFLDLQVGLSTLPAELPQFRKYFARPDVHLGLDPEFAMATIGARPGTVIGTYDAADINFAIAWLSEIVREHKLPPKVLVVHRFTKAMVTNSQDIKATPEVQVVMHMDGWGSRELKLGTYARVIEPEPVQFAGLKIFYKNDLKPPSTGLFTPEQALNLHPEPVYIQYQ